MKGVSRKKRTSPFIIRVLLNDLWLPIAAAANVFFVFASPLKLLTMVPRF